MRRTSDEDDYVRQQLALLPSITSKALSDEDKSLQLENPKKDETENDEIDWEDEESI